MPPKKIPRCIYCPKHGPYTKLEHVFPYSLGGGGDGWTLDDSVCDTCNHSFSDAEGHLARQSLESLSREIYGPKGRKRKKGTRKQKLFSAGSYCIAKDTHIAYEADSLSKGFSASACAQIIIGQALGKDKAHLEEVQSTTEQYQVLECSILALAKNSFIIINAHEKFKQYSAKFVEGIIELSKLEHPLPKKDFLKARNDTLYIERLPPSSTREKYTPRIFKKKGRNMTLKADSLIEALEFLTSVFCYLKEKESANFSSNPKKISIDYVRQNGSQNFAASFQAIAKTGVNFVAKNYGNDFAKSPEFKEIKKFICNPKSSLTEALKFVAITFNHPVMFLLRALEIPETHSMMTVFIPGAGLFFLIRFYGSSEYVVKLGNAKKPEGKEYFEIAIVHYKKREIYHLNPEEIAELTMAVDNFRGH